MEVPVIPLWLAVLASAAEPDVALLTQPFSRMEQALRASDRTLFNSQWHPSGRSVGSDIYDEGTVEKWFFKPAPDMLQSVDGKAWTLSCDVWSWTQSRAVDRVTAVIGPYQGRYVLYGASEDPVAAKALAERVARGEVSVPVLGAAEPHLVLEAVFEAARTGDVSKLSTLCDPSGENDGDTRDLCNLFEGDSALPAFKTAFETGKVAGETVIDGDQAVVPFTFGRAGRDQEEMRLVRRDGRWFLSSF